MNLTTIGRTARPAAVLGLTVAVASSVLAQAAQRIEPTRVDHDLAPAISSTYDVFPQISHQVSARPISPSI